MNRSKVAKWSIMYLIILFWLHLKWANSSGSRVWRRWQISMWWIFPSQRLHSIQLYHHLHVKGDHGPHRTQCQDDFRSLSGCVHEILTACRMLQISIAWCQIDAEIRGFPTMYIMRGGKYGQNWRKTWFRPNFRPKNTNFSGQKFWTSDFGGVCGPKIWNFIIFDSIPTKCGYRRPKLAIGS